MLFFLSLFSVLVNRTKPYWNWRKSNLNSGHSRIELDSRFYSVYLFNDWTISLCADGWCMNVCLCVCATATPNTCHCISSHHLLHGNSISYMKCMKTMYYRTFHQTFLSLFDGILFTFNHFHAIYSVLPWRKFRLSVATAVIVTLSFIFLSQLFVSNFFLHFFLFYSRIFAFLFDM